MTSLVDCRAAKWVVHHKIDGNQHVRNEQMVTIRRRENSRRFEGVDTRLLPLCGSFVAVVVGRHVIDDLDTGPSVVRRTRIR